MKRLSEIELVNKIGRVGLFQTIDDLVGNRFQHLKYFYCRLSNKVYFGSYLAATQGKSIRQFFMNKMVSNYCKNYNNILASKHSDIVSILRGPSDEILPMRNKSNERVIGA